MIPGDEFIKDTFVQLGRHEMNAIKTNGRLELFQ